MARQNPGMTREEFLTAFHSMEMKIVSGLADQASAFRENMARLEKQRQEDMMSILRLNGERAAAAGDMIAKLREEVNAKTDGRAAQDYKGMLLAGVSILMTLIMYIVNLKK